MSKIGDKIKKLRKEAGLTQEELAKKVGIQRGSIAGYEVGKTKPSHKNLEKIANIFNVSYEYLLRNDDNGIPNKEKKNCRLVSLLGNEEEIEPRIYNITKNQIPLPLYMDTDKVYAIKIKSSAMQPYIQKEDICFCIYNNEQLQENTIIHYEYKRTRGIGVVKICLDTRKISIVPLNLLKNKILDIEDKEKLKFSKIIGINREIKNGRLFF